ncbi:MAG: ROK family protein [Albidovulum sp.]|nr:ROK family protein [Albidovulum sp.]
MNCGNYGISLVADVGGTHTRVAVADGDSLLPESVKRFPNEDFSSFEDLVREYARSHGEEAIDRACLAIAAPVQGERAALTNSEWVIDAGAVGEAIGSSRTVLINDLQALGYSLALLESGETTPIVEGREANRNSSRLVVGVGTGFNAAVALFINGSYHVPASECGHSTLNARNREEMDLALHISKSRGFASIEDILSGPGIEATYSWLAGQEARMPSMTAGDVLAAAAAGTDPAAAKAVRIVVRLLGAVCGDLALIHLPFGGIFLAGGVARALVPSLKKHGFAGSFLNKGRLSRFMEQFPVSAIQDDFAALKGCAAFLASERKK